MNSHFEQPIPAPSIGSVRATSHWTPSSVKARRLHRGREASFSTCRMSGAANGEGRPKKGFGQPQASDKASKGKVCVTGIRVRVGVGEGHTPLIL